MGLGIASLAARTSDLECDSSSLILALIYAPDCHVHGGDIDSVREAQRQSEHEFLERVKRAFREDFRRAFA